MSNVALIDVRLLSGGYEVSADHNAGTLTRSKEAKEATTWGDGRDRVYRSGLKSAAFNLAGFFDGPINAIHQAQMVATDPDVTTIITPDGAVGAIAYSFKAITSTLEDFGGAIGDMAAFTVSGNGSGPGFRGTVLEDGETARSTTGNDDGVQLSAVGAGEVAYAALHVIERTGTATVDVTIESDDNGSFTTPTTRLTFDQMNAIGAAFISDDTAVTDDYWRAKWTIGGTGTVTIVVVFGIGTP